MALSFTASLMANIAKVEQGINDKCYKISRELFLEVVKRTPSPSNPGRFAEGLLANQWYPKEDEFSSEEGSSISDTGAQSKSRIRAMRGTAFLRKNGKVTLTNNIDYAYRAEVLGWPSKDGWSGKSGSDGKGGPYRMVALSLQLIAARYK